MRSSPLYQSQSSVGTRPGSAQSQQPQTPGPEASAASGNPTFSSITKPPVAIGNTFLITHPGTPHAFDPYSPIPLPKRLLATGAAANFPSVVNLLTDVFNAPVFVPQTQLDSAHAIAPTGSGVSAQFAAAHRNSPAPGYPSRAALGGAYMARWAWGKERSASSNGAGPSSSVSSFEEDVKRLLSRRWSATTGARARQAQISGGSSPGPYLKHQRSVGGGLGADVLVEEDEEEEGDEITYSVNQSVQQSSSTPTPSTPPLVV